MGRLTSPKLAVNGGRPVRRRAWSMGPSHFADEVTLLRDVLRGPGLPLRGGKYVTMLRRQLGALYGVRGRGRPRHIHVVTTSSGSTAIHVALAALGVGAGDEVITSPLTDYGTLVGIFQLNAVPVFCDVVDGGYQMDAAALEACITARTRAVLPVHNAGYPCDMPAIMKVARRHGLKVVEDGAQSHLTRLVGRCVGTFGDAGAFSTNDSKHMRTGEGGFILFRNRAVADYADYFADKGYTRRIRGRIDPSIPALNVRMSEITAALGVAQLDRLPAWARHRHDVGERMNEIVRQYPLIPHWQPPDAWCSYWWLAFAVDPQRCDFTSLELGAALNAEGIPCARRNLQNFVPHFAVFRRLARDPNAFRAYRPGRIRAGLYAPDICPRAQAIRRRMMAVTINQYTGESEVHDFARALDKIFSGIGGN